MINRNLNKQIELSEKFWKTSPKGDRGERLLSMLKYVMYPKNRSQKLILTNSKTPYLKITIGDISLPHETNTAFVNIINDKTGKVLMTYYERNTIYNAEGKLNPSEHTFRVGPCQYNYPNGQLAALELYDDVFDIKNRYGKIIDPHLYDCSENRLDAFNALDQDGKPMNIGETLRDSHENIVPVEQYDRLTSVYFDPKGKEITQAEFDVIYRNEIEKDGLNMIDGKAFEYAPRISAYNRLVRDLHCEMTAGGDRFSASDIRELFLADKPDQYLDMIAKDIKNIEKRMSDENYHTDDAFLDKQIRSYVYGEITINQSEIIDKHYKEYEIDRQNIERKGPFDDGTTITLIGNPDKHMHAIKKDPDERIIKEAFVIKMNDVLCQKGPAFEYYPDGRISRMTYYEMPELDSFPPIYDMHFDNKGRLTDFTTAARQCEKAWNNIRASKENVRKVKNNIKM